MENQFYAYEINEVEVNNPLQSSAQDSSKITKFYFNTSHFTYFSMTTRVGVGLKGNGNVKKNVKKLHVPISNCAYVKIGSQSPR